MIFLATQFCFYLIFYSLLQVPSQAWKVRKRVSREDTSAAKPEQVLEWRSEKVGKVTSPRTWEIPGTKHVSTKYGLHHFASNLFYLWTYRCLPKGRVICPLLHCINACVYAVNLIMLMKDASSSDLPSCRTALFCTRILVKTDHTLSFWCSNKKHHHCI